MATNRKHEPAPHDHPGGFILTALSAVMFSAVASTSEDVTLESIRTMYDQKLDRLRSFQIQFIEDGIGADGNITSSPRVFEDTGDAMHFLQRMYKSDAEGLVRCPAMLWSYDGATRRYYSYEDRVGRLELRSPDLFFLDRMHSPFAYMGLLEVTDPLAANTWEANTADFHILLAASGVNLLPATDTINGINCRVVEMRESDGWLRLRAWLAPEFGYALVQLDETGSREGRVFRTTCDDFIECADGLFLPRQILRSEIKPNDRTPAEYMRIRILSIELDPILTDHDFAIEFPPDAKVTRDPRLLAREVAIGIAVVAGLALLGSMIWRIVRK